MGVPDADGATEPAPSECLPAGYNRKVGLYPRECPFNIFRPSRTGDRQGREGIDRSPRLTHKP